TVSMAKVAKELGVPSAIIGRMVVTPPNEMVWLTPQDLQSMGTTMVGRPVQTAPEAALSGIGTRQLARQAPQQTQPSDPVALAPPARSSEPLTWDALVTGVVSLSSQQNGGHPKSGRACQPETRTCVNAVIAKFDGSDAMIKVTRDLNDNIIRREFCTFNSSG